MMWLYSAMVCAHIIWAAKEREKSISLGPELFVDHQTQSRGERREWWLWKFIPMVESAFIVCDIVASGRMERELENSIIIKQSHRNSRAVSMLGDAGYKSQPKIHRTSSMRGFEDILLNFFELTWACADGLFHLGAFIDFSALLCAAKVLKSLEKVENSFKLSGISQYFIEYWHFSDPLWKFSQWKSKIYLTAIKSADKNSENFTWGMRETLQTAKLMTYPEFLRACTINWWYDSSFTPKSPQKIGVLCLNPWTPTETCYLLSDDEFNSPTHYHVCAHWSSRASATSSQPVYLSILKIVILTFCWFGLSLGFFFVSWDFSWMKQMRCIVSWCIIN